MTVIIPHVCPVVVLMSVACFLDLPQKEMEKRFAETHTPLDS